VTQHVARVRLRAAAESGAGSKFTRVEVAANDTTGRLTCAATGEPVPTIYWIQPSGQATRYLHPDPDVEASDPARDDASAGPENEGTLSIRTPDAAADSGLFGMYICVANNDAGNVTLTISVPAATSDLPRSDLYFTRASTSTRRPVLRFTCSPPSPSLYNFALATFRRQQCQRINAFRPKPSIYYVQTCTSPTDHSVQTRTLPAAVRATFGPPI